MTHTKIGFAGEESVDIVLYVARMFAAMGKKVAIIDATSTMTVSRAIALPKSLSEESGFYKDVLVLNDALDNRKDIKNQDILFYYFEKNVTHEEISQCRYLIYTTDMAIFHAEYLKQVQGIKDRSEYLIVKNYVPLKYDVQFIASQTDKEFMEENILPIYYDEKDVRSLCMLFTDKKHRLTMLSRQMREIVLYLVTKISEEKISRKELLQLFKRA